MSENTNPADEGQDKAVAVTELGLLKERARMMGIVFSNNIGLEALKAKIQAKMDGEEDEPEQAPKPQINALDGTDPSKPQKTLREMLLEENMKLVRLRITNMDPKKKDLPGEIFTVANEHIGTVKKYIPFGEATDNGYHVPYIIYKRLLARKFLNIRVTKRNGQLHTETSWVREFALEVLEPLTSKELGQLATAQMAAGNI